MRDSAMVLTDGRPRRDERRPREAIERSHPSRDCMTVRFFGIGTLRWSTGKARGALQHHKEKDMHKWKVVPVVALGLMTLGVVHDVVPAAASVQMSSPVGEDDDDDSSSFI